MKYLPIAIAAMLFMGCNDNNRAEDPLADSGRTQRTETLLTNLKQLGDSSVYLFGHHDDTVYGIGWEADYGNDSTIHQRSDVKSVCNDYPALLSFDLGHIELGDERNLDGVPFGLIRKATLKHIERGGIVTFSWHPDNIFTGGDAWDVSSDKVVEAVLPGGQKQTSSSLWKPLTASGFPCCSVPGTSIRATGSGGGSSIARQKSTRRFGS